MKPTTPAASAVPAAPVAARTGRPAAARVPPQAAPTAVRPRFRGAPSALGPVLPVLATILLTSVPADGSAAAVDVTAADLASAVAVVWCAVVVLRRRERPLSRTAVVVLAAPAVALAVATVAARDPAAGLTGFLRLLQILVLVPAALVLLLRGRRHFRAVALCLVVLAVVQGAVGVHQYATGTGASYMGQDVRAVGTFGPLDVMGMATAVSYGVVVALAVGVAPPSGAPRWLRPSALCCSAALLVPLALSFSRGAWIATAVAAVAVLCMAGLRTALRVLAAALAAAVVLVGGFGVGGGMVQERLSSITEVTSAPDQSVTDRYALWSAAVAMWHEDPVTGVGPRGFPAHRDGHASLGLSSGSDTAGAGQEFRRQPLLSPHNMYLLVLGEQGLVGAVAVVGGWAALLVLGVRRVRAAHAAGRTPDCGLAAVGLLVLTCIDFLYGDIGGPSTVLTAVALGLAAWWALAPGAGSGAAGAVPAREAGAGGGR